MAIHASYRSDLDVLRTLDAPPLDPIPFQRPKPPALERVAPYYAMAERQRWYSNNGPCAQLLRERLEAYVGGDLACVLVSSGTMALVVALRALVGATPARREVLVPSFTYIASVGAIRWAGLEPVFVDVAPDHWHLDPDALAEALTRREGRVAAVMACSTFGCPPPAHVRAAWERHCDRAGVALVVDSAAGFGSRDQTGTLLGGQGHAEAFSFHATKPFAIGEGGAVFTADPALAQRMVRQATFGLDEQRMLVDEPGLNAKLSEMHAAIGLAALDEHEQVLAARRGRAAALRDLLADAPVGFQPCSEASTWQFVPALMDSAGARDSALACAGRARIQLRTYHEPLHEMERLRDCPVEGSLDVTRDLASRLVSLPLANDTTDGELARIAALVESAADV